MDLDNPKEGARAALRDPEEARQLQTATYKNKTAKLAALKEKSGGVHNGNV